MAAFEHAVSLGYRFLETDVHRTVDGVLVAFHDSDLRRTCGVDGNIDDMTAAEVSDARVRGADDAEYPIPMLDELFEAFPDAVFNIDAKSDEAVEPLADLVVRTDSVHRVCLASFKLSRIRRLRQLVGPNLMTNMSPTQITALRTVGRVPGSGPRAAQVPPRNRAVTIVTPGFVGAARRAGIPVHVWTVDDREEIDELLELGVDGIMTDQPEVLRDALIDRGHWPS